MKNDQYIRITAAIFALVALGHGLRTIMGWELVYAGITVPVWVSALATVITACLAFLGYRALKE